MCQLLFLCVFCGEDTIHNITDKFVDGKKTISQLICTVCNNHPVHVKHKTDELPLYNSERVLYAREKPEEDKQQKYKEEYGVKEVCFCPVCLKENWGRAKKKLEDATVRIIYFHCFTCNNQSEIIIKKKKK